MADPHRPSKFEEIGIDPEHAERFVGAAALTLVEYFIAGLRFMNGEGREDKRVDPVVEKVLKAVSPHLFKTATMNRRLLLSQYLEDLTAIYRQYQDGLLRDQDQLREVVKKFLGLWRFEATSGQLALLAPDRTTVSRHGGAAQYAKHAVGTLEQVHWKTVHNWTVEAEEYLGRLELDELPYGILVTPEDICAFVNKHANSLGLPAHLEQRVIDARKSAQSLLEENAREAASFGRGPTTAGKLPPPGHVRGPGRPRRKAPR